MVHEFAPFRYDPEQRLLFRDGEIVPLAPKALETLHVLIERRGRIVEKAELMKLVWPDTFVEETNRDNPLLDHLVYEGKSPLNIQHVNGVVNILYQCPVRLLAIILRLLSPGP